NYAITYVTDTTGVITPAVLAITSVSANNRAYDSTTTATLNTGSAGLGGVFGTDVVVLNSGAVVATFGNKNVGVAKPVTVAGFTIGGADAGNYTLTQPAGLTASITAAGLAITGVTANDKNYDGTTAATLNTGTAAIAPFAGDTVTLSVVGATGSF